MLLLCVVHGCVCFTFIIGYLSIMLIHANWARICIICKRLYLARFCTYVVCVCACLSDCLWLELLRYIVDFLLLLFFFRFLAYTLISVEFYILFIVNKVILMRCALCCVPFFISFFFLR